ncbi:hypothetical protein D0Z07_7202 [Hyphodiscus hymeniophilus]|uniref:Uncharacterized protein n=1 Tax=Hyphodiscus hymeniophilus TaxID=353542 RepID=A0A9P6VGA4_9HELO|nr:hypothetical protein D0Z07_7202 [Hyphodiscus hymeniophilus]
MAVEAEISCEGIYEIASSTVESATWKRDANINLESSRKVLKKMEENGITTPRGRKSLFQLQVAHNHEEQNPGDDRIVIHRSWMDELQELQQQFAAGIFSEFIDDPSSGAGVIDDQPPVKKKPRLVVNPDMQRLRRLRAWVERLKKNGETIPTNGSRTVELKILEAKSEAGEIPALVHHDAVPKKKGKRMKINPEWKLLVHLRWRVEARKKQGKPTRLLEKLMELETKFKAGQIEQYIINSDHATPLDPTNVDSTHAESSVQKELVPEESLESEKPKAKRKMLRGLKRTEKFTRMKILERRIDNNHANSMRAAPLFADYEAIIEMQKRAKALEGSDAKDLQREIDEKTANFNEDIENLGRSASETFRHRLDNHRTFQNDPPILYWDRREAEPLQVKPDEFYPEHELCLLDFHPAPLWPVLRQDFPASYDVFEYILSSMFVTGTQSVESALKSVAPGALEWLHAECPSLTDMSKGGNPDLGLLTVRCLTLEMFKEIMEAWMRWPFRPDRFELMKKSGSATYDPDEEARNE